MKAMILVAGEGVRARPLTDFFAKPALPIPGGTILTHLINQLRAGGIQQIALNLHHLPQTIMNAVEKYPVWNVGLHPYDEPVLAGSGGGFYRIRDFFEGEDFLILNGDTITDADLRAIIRFHKENGNMVTFLAKPDTTGSERVIDTDKDGRVTAIRKKPAAGALGFSWQFKGAMVLDGGIFGFFPDREVIDVFDDVMIPMLIEGSLSASIYSPEFRSLEFGTPSDYFNGCFTYLRDFFPSSEVCAEYVKTGGNWIHKSADVGAGGISDSFIGGGCRIEKGACIKKSIIFRSAVGVNTCIEDSIVMAEFIPDGFSCGKAIILQDLNSIQM